MFTGIVLLLSAAGVTAVLAAVLVAVVGAKLRERRGSAEPAAPAAGAAAPAQAQAPRKPALLPWLAATGALAAVAALVSIGMLKGCQAIGDLNRKAAEQFRCQAALQAAAQQLAAYWDRNKALPPDGTGVLAAADCPPNHRLLYLGGRKALLGSLRVLVVEEAPHEEDGEHNAVVVEQSFIDAGKTAAEVEQAANASGNSSNYGWNNRHFQVQQLTPGQFEAVREAPPEAAK